MKKKKNKPFNILYRSNIVQLDEMGYPLRLCIAEGNGREKPELCFLDSVDQEGDLIVKWEVTE